MEDLRMFKGLSARLRGVWMWIVRCFGRDRNENGLQANIFVGCIIEEGSHPETGRALSLALRERGAYPVIVARSVGGQLEVSGRSNWAPVTAVSRLGGVALAVRLRVDERGGDLRKTKVLKELEASEASVIYELCAHATYYDKMGSQVGQAVLTRPSRYLLSDGTRYSDESALTNLVESAISPITVINANFRGTEKRAVLRTSR